MIEQAQATCVFKDKGKSKVLKKGYFRANDEGLTLEKSFLETLLQFTSSIQLIKQYYLVFHIQFSIKSPESKRNSKGTTILREPRWMIKTNKNQYLLTEQRKLFVSSQ